ncbi:hypothetical protein CO661_12070 [Sinorhizobium fredii]|uniref:Peptidase S24/S26A/S26B/S26C domain-containing protein n=1 Tax=Rhizobium fredii TaxID=380 RepID=A0A2A6LYU3_RHIFR|nr:hypothetical protein [Sinorhizobium fredii]PDT47470.1 hypothetical protein CO661_12070 [Sinorhizobium fredii]
MTSANALTSAPAEAVLSSRFRVHPVLGDAMEPTLRGGRDYVLLAPVTSYEGEGVYLLDIGPGVDLFRVSNAFDGSGGLRLTRENPLYGGSTVGREQFNEVVVGIVVADIRARDERFLMGAKQ